jgi:hypothetical protein
MSLAPLKLDLRMNDVDVRSVSRVCGIVYVVDVRVGLVIVSDNPFWKFAELATSGLGETLVIVAAEPAVAPVPAVVGAGAVGARPPHPPENAATPTSVRYAQTA